MRWLRMIPAFLAVAGASAAAVRVEDRTARLKRFPCSECHRSFKKTGSWEKEHLSLRFRHMEHEKRCLLCHAEARPDKLVLLDGTPVPYSESPRLCGQCHGLKFRDWEEGLHGKLLGKGTEAAQRLACTSCHEAHLPKFPAMRAMPAPQRPRFLIEKREDDGHRQ